MTKKIPFDLKPCPFCGRDIESMEYTIKNNCVINLIVHCCVDIDIDADPFFQTSDGDFLVGDDAVTKWNRRANDE